MMVLTQWLENHIIKYKTITHKLQNQVHNKDKITNDTPC
jgi:hypothetical protein